MRFKFFNYYFSNSSCNSNDCNCIIIIVYLNDLSNRPVDPIIKIGFGVENIDDDDDDDVDVNVPSPNTIITYTNPITFRNKFIVSICI